MPHRYYLLYLLTMNLSAAVAHCMSSTTAKGGGGSDDLEVFLKDLSPIADLR